jgi:hypothetical protein
MDILALLQQKYSKDTCQIIVTWVGGAQQRFDILFQHFLTGNNRVTQMAGWPLTYCIQLHPNFINKHYPQLLQFVQQPNTHHAVKRNTVRLLQFVTIPKKYQGIVMDICFTYVAAPKEPVAIKAFALTVLSNLAVMYPEIVPEVVALIQHQILQQSPAFIYRAKLFLQKHNAND